MTEYAVYKGEECLHIGTLAEIAEIRGVKEETIYWYTTQAYQNRLATRKNARNYLTVTRLDDDCDEFYGR